MNIVMPNFILIYLVQGREPAAGRGSLSGCS